MTAHSRAVDGRSGAARSLSRGPRGMEGAVEKAAPVATGELTFFARKHIYMW